MLFWLTKSIATGKHASASSPWASNSRLPLWVPAAALTSSRVHSRWPECGLTAYDPCAGASEMLGSAPGGSGIEMTTLCSDRAGFSSSYSRLTVSEPESADGQQLTAHRAKMVRQYRTGSGEVHRTGGHTRQGHDALVCPGHPPLEHAEALPDREALLALLEADLAPLRPRRLVDVGVRLELQVVGFRVRARGGARQPQDNRRVVRSVDAQVEVALEREGRDAAVAIERERERFPHDEVDAARGDTGFRVSTRAVAS